MSFFSIFYDLSCNIIMSIPVDIFGGSCLKDDRLRLEERWVYPVGVDPRLYRSPVVNSYVNSVQMKLNFIIAIEHMWPGVWVKF